ncbi:MAG: tRNA 2-thiouridine(34) synthase MnmA [Acidimicrobiia bacterium]|jgi:tRNA-specific 2-thiouridylase|nr:tRNA 2-thiouridine(34) synthase MnmA [Acidimicrobiia bacterium]MBP8182370.1 tRNA 2-thiouridine(34) synthase MnmA [Acidimicrobiia bacterium]
MVAMSGGVDSSVAAALLVSQGHDVTGVTLKLWGGDSDSGCCSVSDVEDARRVAAQLGIPHYVFNFGDDFDQHVVQPYVAAHQIGETPNPCVECNRHIKFARLFDRAQAMGFDRIATGHHARVRRDDDRVRLLRGTDPAKDQSYVLYMLTQKELAKTWLPMEGMTKPEVYQEATRLGLRTASKPESMDVCFIQRGRRGDFLSERMSFTPGVIESVDGERLGSHEAVEMVTIGQRRGLGIAADARRYVVDVRPHEARVILGTQSDLLVDSVELRDLTFTCDQPGDARILAQCQAHGDAHPAILDGSTVRFEEPRQRVAPGQIVAFYDGDECLGGGIVAR